MSSRAKNVTVTVDQEALKALKRASESMSELASAFITRADSGPISNRRSAR